MNIIIYFPLYWAIILVGLGIMLYYFHQYEIRESSSINKYRLSPNSILIKMKLFKYDKNFNWLLLIPYLIVWNLFFVVLILYIIYWCGAICLEAVFINKWINISLIILVFLMGGYYCIIRQSILYSSNSNKSNFTTEDEQKKDEKDKNNQ